MSEHRRRQKVYHSIAILLKLLDSRPLSQLLDLPAKSERDQLPNCIYIIPEMNWFVKRQNGGTRIAVLTNSSRYATMALLNETLSRKMRQISTFVA
jgi:hypothetical protein